jgi:hypothetical protein
LSVLSRSLRSLGRIVFMSIPFKVSTPTLYFLGRVFIEKSTLGMGQK